MKVLSLKRERLNFDELASKMETVSREEQKVHIGGGDGSPNNPYTYSEYDEKESNGSWAGGYVVGMGYVAGTAYCYGGGGSGYSSGYGRSTNYNLNDLWWVQQKNDYYYSQNIYGTTPSSSSNNFQNYNGGSSSTGINIQSANPAVAAMFQAFSERRSFDLKNITGGSYTYSKQNIDVVIGNDTIHIQNIDIYNPECKTKVSYYPNVSTMIDHTAHRAIFKWQGDASSGHGIPLMYITVDLSEYQKMEDFFSF